MNKGFTLLEILLAITIALIITGVIVVSFAAFNKEQALDKDALLVSSVLEEARSLTVSSKNDMQYSVRLEEGRVIIFEGMSYSSGDPDNKITELNSLVRISATNFNGGGNTVTFNRLTGGTSQYGTTTVALRSDGSKIKYVVVNATGIIQAQ